MHFRAIGMAGTSRLPIGQEATYLLQRSTVGWRIAAYDAVGHVPTRDEVQRATRRAELDPTIPSSGPMFVLVIGSDARPGADPAHGLADSLHIVGVDPRTGTASILGIPRDSFVPIPGVGTDKINSSLSRGGPDLVVRTVERLSGIHLDGYVLTGFAGFERLVDAVGPIAIDVPYAMNDPSSHAAFHAGRTELNAREALAFSRDRHDAPGGDFGRSLNQGRLLVAALATLRADLRGGDLAVLPWILAGARHLETDLDLWQMLKLLLSAPSVDPGAVRVRVVPGRTATIGGRSVVLLAPEARAMFRDLARDGVLGP
jgi:LCP family protein required for cell wall assembly